MKIRQARKIFKAYYSPKKNYWNKYQVLLLERALFVSLTKTHVCFML